MKTIKDFDLKNKKVIIRVDFNVPIKDGKIVDDTRIKESLETINYAINNSAKVILLSHLGRVKTMEDKKNNTLLPISQRLSQLLNKNVLFINKTRGNKVINAVNNMNDKDIILLENTRIEDYPDKLESNCDLSLAKEWADLGDIFINDAFAVSHREAASVVGIAKYLPSGIGFLIQKELENFLPVINNPKHVYTIILGGSKVSDKIGLIDNLIDKCDYLLIGGAMCYTFLKAQGIEIGKSLVEDDHLDYCKKLLKYTDKIILPIDHMVGKSMEDQKPVLKDKIESNEIGFDIGEKTINLFQEYIKKSKTIVWNGPMGMYENPLYQNGTKELCKAFTKDQTVIIGGGDTGAAINTLGYHDNVTHISTGGGASLELLEGKDLPGIKVIGD